MKLLLSFLVSFIFFSSFSQAKSDQSRIILVKDSVSKQPIEWASISVNHKIYFSSNKSGEITLNESSTSSQDTFITSALGYQSKMFLELKSIPSTIYLSPNIYALNEVVVSSGFKKENILMGNTQIPIINLGGYITRFNTKHALYVPNEDKVKGFIKSLIFYVGDIADGIEMPFKATIYSKKDGNQYPYQEMVTDDIIVTNRKRKRKIIVDVSKYKIQLPENGFFIVAETLSPEFYKQGEVYLHKHYWNKLPAFRGNYSKKSPIYYSLVTSINRPDQWMKFPIFSNGDLWNYSFSAEIILE